MYRQTQTTLNEGGLETLIQKGVMCIEEEITNGLIGYYHLGAGTIMADKACDYANSMQNDNISDIVILGIGGSSLGTKAIDRLLSFEVHRNNRKIHFFENCDPIEVREHLDKLNIETTLIIMISKSGSTIETLSLAKVVIAHLGVTFESSFWNRRFAIITDIDSPLDTLASTYNLPVFHIAPHVGGRFSVLSAVGLVPLALLGYDVKALLKGAQQALINFRQQPKMLAQKAAFLVKNSTNYPINVLFSYSSRFDAFNAWYVQLWGESLGKIDKNGNNVGLTPIGLTGSVDQHSFLQLIVQGPRNKTVTFIKVRDFTKSVTIPHISFPGLEKSDFVNGCDLGELLRRQCDATAETLLELDIPVDVIEVDTLDEKNIGELLMSYELLTSLTGAMSEVNTYDQPGVELGKIRLREKF